MRPRNRLETLCKAVKASGLLSAGDRLLVGLSGGPDSMALLEILRGLSKKYDWKIYAAHVNHLLRGRASDRDEAFVRSWTAKRGVPIATRKIAVAAFARRHRLSLEAAARKIRYDFFEDVARKVGANKIVLAHTADDQAETVLWRLLRGSAGGLAGIPPQRVCPGTTIRIVRPFLSVRKQDLLTYLKRQKIPYRLDHSNHDTRFTRNRIRHRLIPYLEKNFNPAIRSLLTATAQIQDDQRNLIVSLATEAMGEGLLLDSGANLCVDVEHLLRLPNALRSEILKRAFAMAGGDLAVLTSNHIRRCADLLASQPSSKQVLLGPVRVRREQKWLVFGQAKSVACSFGPVALKIPGSVDFPGGNVTARLLPKNGRPWSTRTQTQVGNYAECFDWRRLTPPLTLRPRLPADRYQPIGMTGTKKVKDILKDMKVPLSMRNRQPVLVDATGKIAWLAGYRIAEFCKVRPATRRILVLGLTSRW